jgi:hypothetical protein
MAVPLFRRWAGLFDAILLELRQNRIPDAPH